MRLGGDKQSRSRVPLNEVLKVSTYLIVNDLSIHQNKFGT